MSKRTKKVGIVGKYGTRYGASIRKVIKKIEVAQHSKYQCEFCGKSAMKVRNARIFQSARSPCTLTCDAAARPYLAPGFVRCCYS